MANRQQKLLEASNLLADKFGLGTLDDLLARISLDKLSNSGNEPSETNIELPDEAQIRLMSLLLDTSEGIISTADFIKEVENVLTGDSEEGANLDTEERKRLRRKLGNLLQVHFAKGSPGGSNDNGILNFAVPDVEHVSDPDSTVKDILGYGDEETNINKTPKNPTRDTSPNLAAYLSNSPRISLAQKDINPVVLFMNSIPNVELQRAVPFININFYFAKPPTSDFGNRIQSLGLSKFLQGAQEIHKQDSALGLLVNGNSTRAEDIASQAPDEENNLPETYSSAGMELFTSPQTLVNADASGVENSIRANPVLDKFKPLMSLLDFSINVVPTTGMMSYKTGRLSLALHDRSRLPEVAEFVRADLYSGNEIMIEYGWSHPDGKLNNVDNPYGDLLNGMRVKEKYMVRNSNFTFDDSGQVVINLELAMRGSTDFDTELVSSDNETFSSLIKDIKEIEQTVSELRKRAFSEGQDAGVKVREIRGEQILDAAQDITSHTIMSSDLRQSLRELQRSYRNSNNPDAKKLVEKIEEVFGERISLRRNSQRSRANGQTTIKRIEKTIKESIKNKVEKLQNGHDPFLLNKSGERFIEEKPGQHPGRGRRLVGQDRWDQRRRHFRFQRRAFDAGVTADFPVSLGKLFLHFIGEPLANTGKYDEVQLIFYPFNNFAAKARNINIANFVVDAQYFVDELARYRLSNIGRTANMNLREFVSFIADTLVDDPAARSYGLKDDKGNLFEPFVDKDGQTLDTRTIDNAPNFQKRLENILSGPDGTPDGSFKMPQVDIYIECQPEKGGRKEGERLNGSDEKTILRVHVFDRVATAYDSVGGFLSSAREEKLSSVGHIPSNAGKNEGVANEYEKDASKIIKAALDLNLITPISPADEQDRGPDKMYRIKGGTEELKKFIMKTTPYIIYGIGTSAVKNASLSSMQDAQLSTVNLLRSFRREESVNPNGENPGGLPMRIIPTELSLETFGCPLVNFAQQFFVDFQTGTTADNIYAVSGLEHSFTQGEFNSQIKFAPLDAWGKYESLIARVSRAQDVLDDISNEEDSDEDVEST